MLSYLVLLRTGFTLPRLLPGARCALTAPFHPYPPKEGGIFSVALSVDSHPPGVTWRPALRSPDFPPASNDASDYPADFGGDHTRIAGKKKPALCGLPVVVDIFISAAA